jgi:hypothetical protein
MEPSEQEIDAMAVVVRDASLAAKQAILDKADQMDEVEDKMGVVTIASTAIMVGALNAILTGPPWLCAAALEQIEEDLLPKIAALREKARL